MKTTSFAGNLLSALKNSRRWRQIQLSKFHGRALHARKLRESNDLCAAFSTHARALKSGIPGSTAAANRLINRYVELREIEHARRVFEELPEPNVVSWTSLMAGYIAAGRPAMALWLYGRMRGSEVLPNEFTLTTAAKACSVLADLRMGKRIHAHVEAFGLRGNVVVCSSLVDMYGKCNEVDEARRVFDLMVDKNIVSWTSMIAAYAQSGKGREALHLFWEFNHLRLGFPNHFMLASVVNACSSSGSLVSGRIAHGAVIRYGHEANDVVASALVDMYAKCGYFSYCEKVFRRMENPSVVPYTSMIVGAAKYGLGMLSLGLLEEMVDRGVKPNDVTFLGILHACSHSGLVDNGLEILEFMPKKHGIIPDTRHYTCVVDMLGRIGRLDKAYELAKSIQVRPEEGALLWGTLLSASRLHGRVEIATEASNWLIKSNQQLSGAYVMLSNAHAMVGDWKNAHGLRFRMKHAGVHKARGCSWIEIKNMTYVFSAGDLRCPRRNEVVSLLKELEGKMKVKGYMGGIEGLVFVEVEEEGQEEIVSLHSERLALAFGLISTPKWVTMRIMKNLRMCGACHEAFKIISEIVEREFIVRDVNRFHHFKNGSCACRDFW
ncbi:hypothetical protein ACJRO7_032389 [Eucalyptus globulus]|uniref:DYW domain-containing protein n=1 Tax=Eucalyptus globulus TaxID=34317 RepID=A0ABD3JN51_EUCGL